MNESVPSAPSAAISLFVPIRVCLMIGFCWLSGCAKKPDVEVSLSTCLRELTNTMAFCERPVGQQHLISTYDRTGGNSDWRSFAPTERVNGMYILADLKGPGCVNRMWCTGIGENMKLRIFADGGRDALLEGSPMELFGKTGLFMPPLSDYLSGAFYSYVPVPFRESLQVAISGPVKPDHRLYFQANHTAYADGTVVQPYPKTPSEVENSLWEGVRSDWRSQEGEAAAAKAACEPVAECVVQSGQSVVWFNREGPGTLKAFWVGMSAPPDAGAWARTRQLREVVMRIWWDGATEPSVNVPVGDFFCNGLYRRRFASLPIAVLRDAFVCRFPMPFRKGVRIEIRNDGPGPATIIGGCDLKPETDRGKQVRYFHACWNSGVSKGQPLTVLRANGEGHYVGCYLVAIDTDGSWNMLEGDESIYLDGESVPSMHGTGLEDYFNGGWYYNGLFDRPLHGLVEKSAMRTAQYRFHLSDRVRFEKGITMDWEFGDGNRSQGYMSSVAYWYQTKPRPAGTALPPVSERFPPPDQLELGSIMGWLFELERIGHYDEAAERCLMFAEKYAGHPFVPLLRLRSAAYRELTDGFETVRGTYEAIVKDAPESEAGRQASALLWYHGAATNAIVTAHSNMKVKVYLDGRPVCEGGDPRAHTPLVSLATLASGEHEIVAEATPLCQGPWISFNVGTHSTNVISDETWEYSKTRPANWPLSDDVGVEWTKVVNSRDAVPKMGWWQFVPNAFVNSQSGLRVINPAWNGWEKQPYQTTYLRKRFVVPAPQSRGNGP